MHAVQRRPPPVFTEIRNRYSYSNAATWQLSPEDSKDIIYHLRREFDSICAYCQRKCTPDGPKNTIDHFRPRAYFTRKSLEWDNLVYACIDCNAIKADKWPPRHGYVNPNVVPGGRPAEQFFKFECATGKIYPADNISQMERNMALATIEDLNLNSEPSRKIDRYDPVNLPKLRLDALLDFDDFLVRDSASAICDVIARRVPHSAFIMYWMSS